MKAENPLPLLLVSNARHDQRLSPKTCDTTARIKAFLALFFYCPKAQTQKTILKLPPPLSHTPMLSMRERERLQIVVGPTHCRFKIKYSIFYIIIISLR